MARDCSGLHVDRLIFMPERFAIFPSCFFLPYTFERCHWLYRTSTFNGSAMSKHWNYLCYRYQKEKLSLFDLLYRKLSRGFYSPYYVNLIFLYSCLLIFRNNFCLLWLSKVNKLGHNIDAIRMKAISIRFVPVFFPPNNMFRLMSLIW